MTLRLANLRRPVEEPEGELPQAIVDRLGITPQDLLRWRILRKSLDARARNRLEFVYTVAVEVAPETAARLLARGDRDVSSYEAPPFEDPEPGREPLSDPPVVVGTGPAGLLAGYYLAVRGYRPLLIERGQPVKDRVPAIRLFDAGGPLDEENNYLFGEGGAGTFSDGKLTCRQSGPDVTWVLERFVECGGRPALVYEHRPHLGSNRLPLIVRNFRRKIEEAGGDYRFGCRLEELDIQSGRLRGVFTSSGYIRTTQVVLAIGHSARDTYRMLLAAGLPLSQKAFQLGLRIEQPQDQINRHKYGRPEYQELLGAADYSLVARGQRSLYTFCMCAGGTIIPSVSEPGGFCTNGMSTSRHDTGFANSGLVVTLEPSEFGGDHPLAGVELQRRYEAIAYEIGRRDYLCPIQPAEDFLRQRPPDPRATYDCSYRRGVVPAELDAVLPPVIIDAIRKGLPILDRKWRGDFLRNAMLVGPEMRGSSPVRIDRDRATLQSPACRGLYPVGEGAGYAGGIVSAAVDGLRAAKHIVRQFAPLAPP
ncbi:MAG: FAD-dependent oxidoreductase [Planctomycetes bacterium]|nr:FAD-dependent oxidoreductase [Planctomycetota bacterium]